MKVILRRFTQINILFAIFIQVVSVTCSYGQQPTDTTIFTYENQPLVDSTIIIGDILVVGNNKTDKTIILRELAFKEGDVYKADELQNLIELSTQNLNKISLFNSVIIDFQIFKTPQGKQTSLFIILVKERWYWWIWPLIEHPDRNFNDWWQHQNITRLSAGLHFQHENFSGKSEKLNIKALLGYRNYFEASYEWPYLNKAQNLGLGVLASYHSLKEINYATFDNKLEFYRNDSELMQQGFQVLVSGKYRPGFHFTNIVSIQYSGFCFNDTIPVLNPSFTGASKTTEPKRITLKPQYLGVSYLIKADYRDNRNYPLKGYYAESELSHLSGINHKFSQQSIRLSLRGYVPFTSWLFGAAEITSKFSTPGNPPYYLLTALGYDREFVRGYEYYVVEGQHYSLFKSHLKARFVQTVVRLPWLKIEKFNNIPLNLYAGPHFDYGIAYPELIDNTGNDYRGKPLIGLGMGIDLVSYYDKTFRFEYSYNVRESKAGFFIHFIAMI